jgi:hypothetical protein
MGHAALPLAALTLSRYSEVCTTGLPCVSFSNEIGRKTYAQLRAEFGPRPTGLGNTPAIPAATIPRWLPVVAGVFVPAAVITIAVAVIRAQRRRRGVP